MRKCVVTAVILSMLVLSFGSFVQAATELSTDVVVVGAGGAGLTAAIIANDNGANVIVLEKMPYVGGNSLRATGGLNAAGTKYQEAAGIKDSPDIHFEDTMKGGYYKNDPKLVRIMVDNAKDAVEWLNGLGANLVHVSLSGGSTNARSHAPEGGAAVGPAIVRTLDKAAKDRNIQVLMNTTATHLITDATGKVTGVKATNKDGELIVHAKAVVLATGGFGANSEMVTKYVPSLAGFATTNHPGATGDGITMALEVGATTVQMENIQTHPTVVPNTGGVMITEAVRGTGAILVNRKGERFINELATRDVVSKAILEQEKGTAFLLFDQGVRNNLKAIEDYVKMGLLTQADTVDELAKKLGIPADTLKATVAKYNGYIAAGEDPDCGRTHLERKLETAPFYAVEVTPAIHHTMGGLAIDTTTHVLDANGNPIPGLYAAGEVTGGVHGGNRLGGNAVADIIVFGRIAGQQASEFAKSN